jgi:hypothetical protein
MEAHSRRHLLGKGFQIASYRDDLRAQQLGQRGHELWCCVGVEVEDLRVDELAHGVPEGGAEALAEAGQ